MKCIFCNTEIESNLETCPSCGMSLIESHTLKPGTIIGGKYEVVKKLGEGGFGITYIVKNTIFDKNQAMKELYIKSTCGRASTSKTNTNFVYSSQQQDFDYYKEKFIKEMGTLLQINHENIVRMFDLVEENNTVYGIMEYIDGSTLKQRIIAKGKFSEDEAVEILLKVGGGLKRIHDKNLTHRDIKPDNIMLTENGIYKIIDFGLVKEYQETSVTLSQVVSEGYSPFEQYHKKGKVTPATDIYSLGMTIYAALSKELSPENPTERLDEDIEEEFQEKIENLNTSDKLKYILRKMVKIKSKNRYQSFDEIFAELEAGKVEDKPEIPIKVVKEEIPEKKIIDEPIKQVEEKKVIVHDFEDTTEDEPKKPDYEDTTEDKPADSASNKRPEDKKFSKRSKIIIISAIVIIVVFGSWFGYYLYQINHQYPSSPADVPDDGYEEGFFSSLTDLDNDGISDQDDECPDDPEDFDGFEDEDGCPELDNDKDEIYDEDDKCPNDPEDYNGFEDDDGCPDSRIKKLKDGNLIPDSELGEISERNKAQGEIFLAQNKDKVGVKVTSSGLQYMIIKEGKGPKPLKSDKVKVRYIGTFINGEEFDNTYAKDPAIFALEGLIIGFTEGLMLMNAGSKYKFFIPPELAYGVTGVSGKIEPNSVLIYEIELIDIIEVEEEDGDMGDENTGNDKTCSATGNDLYKQLTFRNKDEVDKNLENLVFVQGGSFQMGSNEEDDEKPIHKVTLNDFYIGKTEVTQKQYKAVMGNNPSHFKGDNLPVESVSWHDAVKYCKKLSKKEGVTYRLPTEAEWEYAARGGISSNSTTYAGSDNIDEVGWCGQNSSKKTHPFGTKQPNELGIYDMSGNIYEWCNDWYDENYYMNSSGNNPAGPGSGTFRVLRGGSWTTGVYHCRFSNRYNLLPEDGSRDYVGFRVVRTK